MSDVCRISPRMAELAREPKQQTEDLYQDQYENIYFKQLQRHFTNKYFIKHLLEQSPILTPHVKLLKKRKFNPVVAMVTGLYGPSNLQGYPVHTYADYPASTWRLYNVVFWCCIDVTATFYVVFVGYPVNAQYRNEIVSPLQRRHGGTMISKVR